MTLYHYKADLVRVVDGDTIVVNVDLGFSTWKNNVTMRLERIDSYESKRNSRAKLQCLRTGLSMVELTSRGSKSRERLEELLCNARLHVSTRSKDSFGRYLAEVYVELEDSTELCNVNSWLLENQLALEYID